MAKAPSRKACSVNPLKLSRPLGGVNAFLGLDSCQPLLHGAQGCCAFGTTFLVKHYRENIPLQNTAMSEVSTILGGGDNLETAILNIAEKFHPAVIGICSNGLIETRGEDIRGDLKRFRKHHPELSNTALIYAQTPDYQGAFQDGWADAVEAIIDNVPLSTAGVARNQVNVLAGSHLTSADIDEIRDLVESFGLKAIVLPDISGSLDGHLADDFTGNTDGGTTLSQIHDMGRSAATLAIGQHMEKAAKMLEERRHVPAYVFPRLTGLSVCDSFVDTLRKISGRKVPAKVMRWRSQLLDAMLDGHFYFGGKSISIAAEPDQLYALSTLVSDMGAYTGCAVTTTQSDLLKEIPAKRVLVGDLGDIEDDPGPCDLLIANSQARRLAGKLHVPLFCVGLPLFDRLGAAYRLSVGYRGTRTLIFELANLLIAHEGTSREMYTEKHNSGGFHAPLAAG